MRHLFLLALFSLLGFQSSLAQQPADAYTTVHLPEWPSVLYERSSPAEGDDVYPYDLLASMDTFALGYAYAVEEDLPVLDFALAWMPGPYGVYNDRPVRYDDLPGEVVIAALDLRADVEVEGEIVADLVLSLDSLVLGPAPEQFYVTDRGIPWDQVFGDTQADDARAYFASGFALRNLKILRIAFVSYPEEEVARYEPRYPREIGVYPPRISIWVDWLGPSRSAGKRGTTTRPDTPREGIGRTEVPSSDTGRRTRSGTRRTSTDRDTEDRSTTRTSSSDRAEADDNEDKARRTTRSGKAKKKKDDEEDDDQDLLPGALVGVAAIGVVAFAGGTIGYYGNTKAPIGLTSGMVRGKGGAVLQGAVNEAVLGKGDEPEQAIARIMSFYNVFNAPIRPAVGLGVLLEENGDEIDFSPSVSLGAVGVFGPILLYGGYDIFVGGADFGLAVNFRYKQR
ncbi:MAG TPA: hypothetical protein VKP65_21245 [Rhodothermales bacterium]|nr:hypothetical protein [Rhodothermales bacterium]